MSRTQNKTPTLHRGMKTIYTLIVLPAAYCSQTLAAETKRPYIVFVMADDIG